MRNGTKLSSLVGLVCLGIVRAAHGQTITTFYSINRYYDANNAVSASQLLGVPMPLASGRDGDWKLSISPAYVQVNADPLKMQGGSLNFGLHKTISNGWGVYAIALTNYVKTNATSDSGVPNSRLLAVTGFDTPPAYSGSQASGGSMLTFAESAGISYSFRLPNQAQTPVSIFGGPAITQAYARNLDYSYAFSGNAGGRPATLTGTADSQVDAYLYGATIGASAEVDVGSHIRLVPHAYEVVFFSSHQSGSVSFNNVATFSGVPSPNSGTLNFRDHFGTIYFPVPGMDVIYRDWSLGFNVIEPFGGLIAKTTADNFLHGAWPFSLRITRTFGNYEK